jgi:Flp pilus assembly pilin Flp
MFKILKDQEGAIFAEYALLTTLIAIACVAAVALLGESLPALFESVGF